jgi:hypothetical protein
MVEIGTVYGWLVLSYRNYYSHFLLQDLGSHYLDHMSELLASNIPTVLNLGRSSPLAII